MDSATESVAKIAVSSSNKKKYKKKKEGKVPRPPGHKKHFLLLAGASSLLPQSHSVANVDLGARFALLDDQGKLFFRKQTRYLINEVMGTQMPILRLPFVNVQQPITTGVWSGSIPIQWISVIDQASWAVIFDEARPITGKYVLHGTYQLSLGSVKLIGAGAIDYDSSSSSPTFGNILQYDTAKVFDLCSLEPCIVKWKLDFRFLPDHTFTTTANNVIWAWFWFSNATSPTITSGTFISYNYGEVFIQFRQLV